MNTMNRQPLPRVERLLLGLDTPPWSGILRLGLGLFVLPAFHRICGRDGSIWELLILLAGLLLALRLVPAILRKLFPFSREARAAWAERRLLGRRFDSYLWQKLFWIGMGLLLYAMTPGERRLDELVLAFVCVVAGALGLVAWRRVVAGRKAHAQALPR
jgi:hypothetical protein